MVWRQSHGMAQHELYPIWVAIRQRCGQETHPDYPRYGGRGIRLCAQWQDVRVFIEDVEREIGPRPPDRLPNGHVAFSLDRRDNDGDYEPGNIRWATRLQQVLNRGSAPWEDRWARLRNELAGRGMAEAVSIMDGTPLVLLGALWYHGGMTDIKVLAITARRVEIPEKEFEALPEHEQWHGSETVAVYLGDTELAVILPSLVTRHHGYIDLEETVAGWVKGLIGVRLGARRD